MLNSMSFFQLTLDQLREENHLCRVCGIDDYRTSLLSVHPRYTVGGDERIEQALVSCITFSV